MNETKSCPYCGEEILATAKKCKHCGKWLEKKCPQCGEWINAEAKKCRYCGSWLDTWAKEMYENINPGRCHRSYRRIQRKPECRLLDEYRMFCFTGIIRLRLRLVVVGIHYRGIYRLHAVVLSIPTDSLLHRHFYYMGAYRHRIGTCTHR